MYLHLFWEIFSRTTGKRNKLRLLLPSFSGSEFELSGETKRVEKNLELKNGITIIPQVTLVIVQTNASKKEWRPFCRQTSVGCQYTKKESVMHTKILQFRAVLLAPLTFTGCSEAKSFMSRLTIWLSSLI